MTEIHSRCALHSVLTRFPPEPNGYLHLGHLKAMTFDFDLHSQDSNGACILRMDDTNPEAEKQEYVDSIIEDVLWLGYTPHKITYTSEYFKELYNFAIMLIKKDKAYTDKTDSDKIKDMRHNGIESVYRNMPVEYHLEEFQKMKSGFYKENEIVLRLKIDMRNDNHTLRDPVAYRVKYTPHYKTGTEWIIYPSYDYSHGLVDALENITYSYCTAEFYVRREQYYWPVKELGLVPAEVHEFGRLNVENNVLSKRKIIKLVEEQKVAGFDDPRLLTIKGLKKRGFTPAILKKVISACSLDRDAKNDSLMTVPFIHHCLRDVLDKVAKRAFAVIDPVELIIKQDESCSSYKPINCIHPNHPTNKDLGEHITELGNNVYIERTDFKEVDEKNYYRLAPEKTIRLKYADFVKYSSHTTNENSLIISCFNHVPENPKKIKGVIHWVSKHEAVPAKFELFESLFENDEFNPKSKITLNGYVERYVNHNLNEVFQFERLGFFKFDRMVDGIPVFIRVIELVDKFNTA